MKKLQQNFTTTEQSKRLLELGIPVDSADCYSNSDSVIVLNGKTFQENYNEDLDLARLHLIEYPHYIPCWSAGRLMEIYLTCALEYHPYDDFYTETPSLHLMAFDKDRLIEEVIEIMSEDEMDFSKLEE